MLHGLESCHSTCPTTMAMRIEEAGIRLFQILLGTEAGGSQRTATLRTRKQKDVRKLIGDLLQRTLAFPRARGSLRLAL